MKVRRNKICTVKTPQIIAALSSTHNSHMTFNFSRCFKKLKMGHAIVIRYPFIRKIKAALNVMVFIPTRNSTVSAYIFDVIANKTPLFITF